MLKDFAIWCAESFGKSIFYLLEKYTNMLAFQGFCQLMVARMAQMSLWGRKNAQRSK